MIFGIGPGEFIGLAILAIFFVGPERLPKFSSDAAKFLKKLKNLANTATTELRENLGPGFEDLQPSDLNPKTFIKKQILLSAKSTTASFRSMGLSSRRLE